MTSSPSCQRSAAVPTSLDLLEERAGFCTAEGQVGALGVLAVPDPDGGVERGDFDAFGHLFPTAVAALAPPGGGRDGHLLSRPAMTSRINFGISEPPWSPGQREDRTCGPH